jgi:hypothetical protein
MKETNGGGEDRLKVLSNGNRGGSKSTKAGEIVYSPLVMVPWGKVKDT